MYEQLKLKTYNKTLKSNMRLAKQQYYDERLDKYKSDIKNVEFDK